MWEPEQSSLRKPRTNTGNPDTIGLEDRIRAFEDLIFKGALSFAMQKQNRPKMNIKDET